MLKSVDAVVWHRFLDRAVEMLRENGLQRLVDECSLARTAYARHHNQLAKRELDIHMLQIVARCTSYPQAVAVAGTSLGRYIDVATAGEIGGGRAVDAVLVMGGVGKMGGSGGM